MSDLIEREAAIEALKAHEDYKGYIVGDYEVILSNEVPAAQPKKGKWIWDENGMDWGLGSWICSACYARPGTTWQYMENIDPLQWNGSKFCPNCGADMRGEKNE